MRSAARASEKFGAFEIERRALIVIVFLWYTRIVWPCVRLDAWDYAGGRGQKPYAWSNQLTHYPQRGGAHTVRYKIGSPTYT